MPIIAKGSSTEFVNVSEGPHPAVCVDVVDMGVLETKYGNKHKVRIVWETDEMHPDEGFGLTVSKFYTLSLHPDANLTKDLESWRGKRFTDDERGDGFDIEKLIGAPAFINVVHGEKYAEVSAIMPCPKNQRITPSGSYVRVQDREEDDVSKPAKKAPRATQVSGSAVNDFNSFVPDDEDELPF